MLPAERGAPQRESHVICSFPVPLVPVHTKRLVVNRGTLHSHEHFSTFEAPGEF